MNKTYIGIDPGEKGGIALITNAGKVLLYDMPLEDNSKNISSKAIVFILKKIKKDCFCVLEKAQSMPNQGIVSSFNYGVGYGKILSSLKILRIPFIEIRPQRWKAFFSLKRDKKESVNLAIKFFPETENLLITKKGHLKDGRAEALLMAMYAKRLSL